MDADARDRPAAVRLRRDRLRLRRLIPTCESDPMATGKSTVTAITLTRTGGLAVDSWRRSSGSCSGQ